MAKKAQQDHFAATKTAPLFLVKPTRQALRESKIGGALFQKEEELLWVVSQLKLLRHWPLDKVTQTQFKADLDFSKVEYEKEYFFELRLDDESLHNSNLRVFFWVHDKKRTIWIIHGYWKKSQRLEKAVKAVVARRIKNLKGGIQDGSVA